MFENSTNKQPFANHWWKMFLKLSSSNSSFIINFFLFTILLNFSYAQLSPNFGRSIVMNPKLKLLFAILLIAIEFISYVYFQIRIGRSALAENTTTSMVASILKSNFKSGMISFSEFLFRAIIRIPLLVIPAVIFAVRHFAESHYVLMFGAKRQHAKMACQSLPNAVLFQIGLGLFLTHFIFELALQEFANFLILFAYRHASYLTTYSELVIVIRITCLSLSKIFGYMAIVSFVCATLPNLRVIQNQNRNIEDEKNSWKNVVINLAAAFFGLFLIGLLLMAIR